MRLCLIPGSGWKHAETCATCPVPPQVEVLRTVNAFLEAQKGHGGNRLSMTEEVTWLARLERDTKAALAAVEECKR